MAKPVKKPTLQPQVSANEAEFQRVLESLPKQDQQIILAGMTEVTSYSGPLPHPEMMAGYEQIQAGFAERIMKMTENQSNHRIDLEKRIVKRSLNQKLLGMILGGIFTLAILGIVLYLALTGHDWLAGIFGTTTLIGIASIFVLGYSPNDKRAGKNSKGN